jgi:hypothetical protein
VGDRKEYIMKQLETFVDFGFIAAGETVSGNWYTAG